MDFGYSWLLTYGHLLLAVPAAFLAVWLNRRRKVKLLKWLFILIAVWATASFFIVKFGFRLDAPVKIPTSNFLASGKGRVLDLGCGSGRSSIGVLLARPQASVVGLDNWSGDYIQGNGPDLLLANARSAGVGDRIDSRSSDMRTLPFKEGTFDAVISAYAVDHLDPEGILSALTESIRVLRPGGEILLMNMHRDGWTQFVYTPLFGMHSSEDSTSHNSGVSDQHSSIDAHWKARLEHVGFEMIETGRSPGTAFYLARKPDSAGSVL
jgi:SAM-dependent methyltransferase